MRLFLRQLITNIPQRRNKANRPVRPSCVVPKEPIHKFTVECLKIIGKEMTILGNKRFRESPIEPFNLGVHLRRSWIGMKVNNALPGAKRFKMI